MLHRLIDMPPFSRDMLHLLMLVTSPTTNPALLFPYIGSAMNPFNTLFCFRKDAQDGIALSVMADQIRFHSAARIQMGLQDQSRCMTI